MQRKTIHPAYLPTDLARFAKGQKPHSPNGDPGHELHRYEKMQDKMEDFSDSSSCFVMLDLISMNFVCISKDVKKIFGYDAEDFMNGGLAFGFELVHPKDLIILKDLHEKLFSYYYATPVNERTQLKFTYNLRFRRKDSSYMHILQQTAFNKISEHGRPLVDFSTVTDITPFKKDNHITLAVHKLNTKGEYEQVYKEDFFNYDFAFTPRQLEIISLISKGLTTREIAAYLFLSIDTVKNHRKNILKMTGSKNVVEVVNTMAQVKYSDY